MILRGVLSGLKTDIVDEIQRARVVVVVVYRRIDRVPCLALRVGPVSSAVTSCASETPKTDLNNC